MAIALVNYFLGKLIFDKQSLPTSCIPLYYLVTIKTDTYLYGYCVLISCKTYNHRCQRKQMHHNYFRITTALCHLTAVLA